MSKASAGAAMTTTKERILDTTAELFKRYGFTGTGLKQIVADANAPFGSVYHHFPGGKAELGEAVIRRSGQMYLELVMSVFDSAPDPLSAVDAIFAGAAAVLSATDYIDACPIATVALEVASSNEPLRIAPRGPGGRGQATTGCPSRPPRCSRAGSPPRPPAVPPAASPRIRRAPSPS